MNMRKAIAGMAMLVLLSAYVSVQLVAYSYVLKFGLSAYPPTLDPHISGGTAARTVKTTVYEGLMTYTPEGDIAPQLAESVEVLDPITYIFHLRKGVVFHSGKELTAADVVYSFQRILDPSTGAVLREIFSTVLEDVVAENDYTIIVKLRIPFAPFLEVLATPEASIVSAEWMAQKPDLKTTMNGTGPFKLKSLTVGVEIFLVKNECYYIPGLPKVEGISFQVFSDPDARLNALLTGAVDIIEYVEWRQIPILNNTPGFVVDLKPAFFQILSVNCSAGPLADPRVRRAISYAINREEIVAACFEGYAEPLYGALIPKGHWAYNEDLASFFEYNPARAKELLAEAGYPQGFTVKLLATSAYSTHWCPAEVIQAQLAEVGIKVELELVDWPTRVQRRSDWNYELASDGLSGYYNDPDFYYAYFHGAGPRYCHPPYFDDPVVNDLLEKGRATLDRDVRKQIYHDLEARLLDLSPWIFLCYRLQPYAYAAKVHGFVQLLGFLSPYSGVTLKYASVD